MKKTVWEIDSETRLEYHHTSEEIFINQDSRHPHGGKLDQASLDAEMVGDLVIALGELKALLDAEMISKIGEAA